MVRQWHQDNDPQASPPAGRMKQMFERLARFARLLDRRLDRCLVLVRGSDGDRSDEPARAGGPRGLVDRVALGFGQAEGENDEPFLLRQARHLHRLLGLGGLRLLRPLLGRGGDLGLRRLGGGLLGGLRRLLLAGHVRVLHFRLRRDSEGLPQSIGRSGFVGQFFPVPGADSVAEIAHVGVGAAARELAAVGHLPRLHDGDLELGSIIQCDNETVIARHDPGVGEGRDALDTVRVEGFIDGRGRAVHVSVQERLQAVGETFLGHGISSVRRQGVRCKRDEIKRNPLEICSPLLVAVTHCRLWSRDEVTDAQVSQEVVAVVGAAAVFGR